MQPISELWYSRNVADWEGALNRYWDFVPPANIRVERAMECLDRERVRDMTPDMWFDFLLNHYFRWKYTAANRYKTTTTALLKKAFTTEGRAALHRLKARILAIDPDQIRASIATADEVPGLGVAGASGLLALLFPNAFATVDQFVVKALCEVEDLPEAKSIAKMNPKSLTATNGEILIKIMRRKAVELTEVFGVLWRPRDIDKVLWTYGRE